MAVIFTRSGETLTLQVVEDRVGAWALGTAAPGHGKSSNT